MLDSHIIIFVAGTAASFLPLYWILSKFARRHPRHAVRRSRSLPVQNGRSEFLDLLRREVIARVAVTLDAAIQDLQMTPAGASTGSAGLSDETRRRLADMSQLVGSLFAGDVRERFERHASLLYRASPGRRATLGDENAAIVAALQATMPTTTTSKRPNAAKPAKAWSAVLRQCDVAARA